MGKSAMISALIALLLLSACTVMITPEAGTGEATPAPQEEATSEATEEPSEEAADELVGPTWQWVETEMGDGTLITPSDPSRYTLTFHEDGTVSAQLDCNSGSGTYEVDGATLTFGPMASTLMACPEDSLANDFSLALENVNSHVFQDGHLFLALKLDSGIMEFAPVESSEEATPVATEEASEEASDASGELVGPTWQWIQTQYGDDTVLVASDPTVYTLTFHDDGTVSAQIDCNSGSGTYTVDGPSLTFGPMATTLMACLGESQADQFATDLSQVNSHVFQDGHLFLALQLDSGIMEFAPAEASEEATPEATEEPSEEASDASGELVGPTWQWVETEMGDGALIVPSDPSRYTLTFHDDGTVSAQLDCNNGSGTYEVDGPTITFGPMASTMMACPDDSQADQFANHLSNVNSHVFQDGHLFLALKLDSGIMEFAPVEADGEATPEATEEANEEGGDMEGELVGPTWQWLQSVYEGDMIVASNDPTRYTITFLEDGTFQAQLDCNTGFGSYTVDGSGLTIGPIGSTRMACPDDSLDSTFIEDLESVTSYIIADGNLHLTLSTDGVMELAPAP